MRKEDFNDNQKQILKLLMERAFIQKELQKILEMSSPGLLYHLNKLENLKLIQKITLQKVGNAKINEIRIEPLQLQNIRKILEIKIKKCTMLTGYGELETGYRIPDQNYALLQNKIYQIDRVVCITTNKGKNIRQTKEKEEKLIEIQEYYANYEYTDFRYLNSHFFRDLDGILRKELKDSNLIIDLTPLTKLYSFELLKRANQYQLACFYMGHDHEGKNSLIWMTDVDLEGEYA